MLFGSRIMRLSNVNKYLRSSAAQRECGFTIVEVIVAAGIMIILCVGTLTVFSHAVKINSGNNLRAQAQSVLQQEVEYYRSLKFVPGAQTPADLVNHRSTDLYAGNISRGTRTSSDGTVFNLTVTVSNLYFSPGGTDEAHCTYKEIFISATPAITRTGWLANLRTNVTVQRVRAN